MFIILSIVSALIIAGALITLGYLRGEAVTAQRKTAELNALVADLQAMIAESKGARVS